MLDEPDTKSERHEEEEANDGTARHDRDELAWRQISVTSDVI